MSFALSFFIFYKEISGQVTSDFLDHIKSSMNGEGYSIMSFLILICNAITPSNISLVFLMSILCIITIIGSAKLMEFLIDEKDIDYINLIPLASTSLFISKITISELSPIFYKRVLFVTQPWHNSTYILMRMFGIFAILYYFKIRKKGFDKLVFKNYFLFSSSLIVVNLCKPNYIIVFAPSLLIILIYNLLKDRKTFFPSFKIGICVLVSLIVLFFQYKVLYTNDSSSGIALSINNAISWIFYDNKLIINIFLTYLFVVYCAYILLFKNKDKNYYLLAYNDSLLFLFIGILEYLFIVETGPRAGHGNFGWSGYFFSYLIFVVSLSLVVKQYHKGIVNKSIYTICILFYLAHIVNGIAYYIGIVIGCNVPWGF